MGKQELKNKRKSEPDIKVKTNGTLPPEADKKKSSLCSCFNFSLFLVILGVGAALAAIIAKSLELQTQNELLQRDIRSAHAGMKTLKSQKEEYGTKIKETENQLQQLQKINAKDLKVKDDLIAKQKNEIINVNNQKTELNDELLSTSTELKDHQLLLENQEAKIKSLDEEKEQMNIDLENFKQDRNTVVTDLGATINELEEEKIKTNTVVTDLGATIKKLEDEKLKTNIVVEDQEVIIQNLGDDKKGLDILVSKLEKSIQTLEKERDNLGIITDAQNLKIETLEEEKDNAISAAEDRFFTLKNECDDKSAGLRATITQQQKSIDDSALDLINCQNEMGSKIELLESEQKSCEEATKALQLKEVATETKNELLKKEMSEYQTLMQTKQDALKLEMDSSIVGLQKEKEDLESAMKKKYESLEKQKQEKINILESSNVQLIEDVKLEKSEKNKLFDDKTELARSLEDLKSENKQLDKNLKVAQVDIGDCIVDKTEMKNKVDDLEKRLSDVDACTAENASIKEKVADLERKLLDKKEPIKKD